MTMRKRVDLDMDLARDEASSFGPDSVSAGALLPYEGRTHIRRSDRLPSVVLDVEEDGWLSPNSPVLVRGLARILPLAWRGDPQAGHGSGVSPEEIAAMASQMQSAGSHWAGNWRVLDLADDRGDSIGSYTAALLAGGATHVDCWTYSETIGLALVWAGAEDEGTMSLALHVVPASWVSELRSKKAVHGIDVRWSWTDVVALYAARTGTEHAETPERSTALLPESVQTGAVITWSGESLVASGDVLGAVESRLMARGGNFDRQDQWVTNDIPVLSRGDAWIVPLSWHPPLAEIDETTRRTLDVRASELYHRIQSACSHGSGYPLGIDLASGTSYAFELARTGAKDAAWWEFGTFAVVLVIYGKPSPAPKESMALHVVPIGWVSERRSRLRKKIPPPGLEWSWIDVVKLARKAGKGPDISLWDISRMSSTTEGRAPHDGDRRLAPADRRDGDGQARPGGMGSEEHLPEPPA